MRWMTAASITLAFLGGAAQAQVQYHCRSSSGTAYTSSSPCNSYGGTSASSGSRTAAGASRQTGVTYYGPADSGAPRYQPPPPSIGEAPPHMKFMSPRCSSLHDALRTASARGLRSETVQEMRKGYRDECAENEREAHAALSRERGEKVQQQRASQNAEKQARERTALQEQQCGESKRILVTKRARTDLNEGEKAELRRFEENYRSRCG
jgi:hypothetical protein